MANNGNACEVCGGELHPGLALWHRCCEDCGLEVATFNVHIDHRQKGEDIDEDEREIALRPIREANFDKLLDWVLARRAYTTQLDVKPRLLDVGCAHGWFLEKASPYFEVFGIEPDAEVASRTIARGFSVRRGYFPDVLNDDEMFDVIVFNDVLEHIPNVVSDLRECKKHLREGGIVLVNAPDRRGFLYRIACTLSRFGVGGGFDRLWQKGLPSPHLYYFDTKSLSVAADKAGLNIVDSLKLPSLIARGLYARIHCSGDISKPKALLLTAIFLPIVPILRVLPSDITVWLISHKK